MGKSYKLNEENAKEIREEMKKCKNKNAYRRMEAVALRCEGKSNAEVSEITQYHYKRVSQLVSYYCNYGLAKISEDGRKGGNHKNMSREKEQEILEIFTENATEGHIITPSEIKKKYDEKLGRETTPTFIYAVLNRNNWRQIMPRSKHPEKASDEAINASKKLTLVSRN